MPLHRLRRGAEQLRRSEKRVAHQPLVEPSIILAEGNRVGAGIGHGVFGGGGVDVGRRGRQLHHGVQDTKQQGHGESPKYPSQTRAKDKVRPDDAVPAASAAGLSGLSGPPVTGGADEEPGLSDDTAFESAFLPFFFPALDGLWLLFTVRKRDMKWREMRCMRSRSAPEARP
ncbi:uncharacterized protein BcabD6B2_47840 [Babesia caballi]|uniref:Uncharacterized protein n=1 Tax=Babesia caballi TaxID=5871 RepID=A0AAV4LZ25_BABCB|nr:hypothetical protein BcabD6B2_47840 [Babesia caballi]